MYTSWQQVFPEARDLDSDKSREEELTEFPPPAPAFEAPTVVELSGLDGPAIRVRPPKHGRGVWVVGVITGLAFVAIGIAILVAPAGGSHTLGSIVGVVACFVVGIAFAALMLAEVREWRFDDDGIHRSTGLGRRTTSWDEVARIRIVVLRRAPGPTYDRLVRLYFLDENGRALTFLPHVSRSMRRRRWSDELRRDIDVVRFVAHECERHGWLIGVAAHQLAGNAENITALMDAAAADADEVGRLATGHPELAARDSEGLTALHYAAAWGEPDAVRHLISAGAEIDARTPYGFTPLRLAESRDRATAVVLRAAGATSELPPFTPVRFTRSHWRPVVATLIPAAIALVAVPAVVAAPASAVGRIVGVVAGVVAALLVLRVLRPTLFWSGGVPTHQAAARLTLRAPWGRLRHIDLDQVIAAVQTPPMGYEAGRVHGTALLLVVPSGGWRLTDQRLRALHLDHRREQLLAAGSRGVLVILDPRAQSTVVATIVPWLVAGRASIEPALFELLPA